MGCSSGIVSWAISIIGGWYAWIIEEGRDEARAVLVLVGAGESLAGLAECWGEEEV